MERPRQGQDSMYQRFSDMDVQNMLTENNRTSAEDILAYATRVLNRESKVSVERKGNREMEEETHNCGTRRSSCAGCEKMKSLLLAETVKKSKTPKGKKKNTKAAAKDENPPVAFAHTWDSCIAVTKPLRKPTLSQLLERYPKINMIFLRSIFIKLGKIF